LTLKSFLLLTSDFGVNKIKYYKVSKIISEKHKGKIYTVSQLTGEIKTLIEEKFPFVWIMGEISNYSVPASGHSYFTLKDQKAVIQAVMFKNQKSKLKFQPANGMKIYGIARLSLYEPRGSYQLFFEHLEPDGIGSLQIAFEQLKEKLFKQGLFDSEHKKAIPFLPSVVCVITSKSGAAIKDIINVSGRRFENRCLEIFSVTVQGEESINEICDALHYINEGKRADLIIIARGGGSFEDLMPFNSEAVALAVFNSKIPVITGIGHETDYTIADFVADLRAPTPSAAAELAFPDKQGLVTRVIELKQQLDSSIINRVSGYIQRTYTLKSRLKTPETLIYNSRLKVEEYKDRLTVQINKYIKRQKERTQWITEKLETLSPYAVLKRGYSITKFSDNGKIITDFVQVNPQDNIDIILHKGNLTAKVEKSNA
jgi:exodeoxyribonuclease VII large subunit